MSLLVKTPELESMLAASNLCVRKNGSECQFKPDGAFTAHEHLINEDAIRPTPALNVRFPIRALARFSEISPPTMLRSGSGFGRDRCQGYRVSKTRNLSERE